MTSIVYAGLGVVLALGLYATRAVRREFQTCDTLSPRTVAAVWGLYILHAALTVLAAWRAMWPLPLPTSVSLVAGAGITATGFALAMAATLEFRSFRRMSGMLNDRLVRTGTYRWSRNPQNVGWGTAFVGVALLGHSGFALLLAAIFWVMFFAYVPAEEAYLERIFGDEYRRYFAATPRVLGRPRASDQRISDD